jgi:hypothetical protein
MNKKPVPQSLIQKRKHLRKVMEIAEEFNFYSSDITDRKDAKGFERREDKNHPLLQMEVQFYTRGISWTIESPNDPRCKRKEYNILDPDDLRKFLKHYMDEVMGIFVEELS